MAISCMPWMLLGIDSDAWPADARWDDVKIDRVSSGCDVAEHRSRVLATIRCVCL
ncbi:MAG: hypothetical protein H6512_14120 [Acidimicrobiia bacterium]|nr:hypothetical protein [Acidimicrobiia bacterium]